MMRTFQYRKFIRDKILQSMLDMGEKPEWRELSDDDYAAALQDKLIEESAEIVLADKDKLVSELADLQEVLDCLADTKGITREEIVKAQAKKNDKVGSFKQRIFVEVTTLPDDNEWITYLQKHPERYPEIKD